jgi:hypothetical protein
MGIKKLRKVEGKISVYFLLRLCGGVGQVFSFLCVGCFCYSSWASVVVLLSCSKPVYNIHHRRIEVAY